jgi:hypothetical protein
MNLGSNFPGPFLFAQVVDGEVKNMFGANERLGAILLSNPIVLDITGRDFKTEGPMPGWTWNGTSFNPPVEEQ